MVLQVQECSIKDCGASDLRSPCIPQRRALNTWKRDWKYVIPESQKRALHTTVAHYPVHVLHIILCPQQQSKVTNTMSDTAPANSLYRKSTGILQE